MRTSLLLPFAFCLLAVLTPLPLGVWASPPQPTGLAQTSEDRKAQVTPFPHRQANGASGVHGSLRQRQGRTWFMVHSHELSTMNYEPGGFHPHPLLGEAISPPLVEQLLLQGVEQLDTHQLDAAL